MTSSGDDSLYAYDPNKVLPIVFAVYLTFHLLGHIYLSFIHYKWWHFGLMISLASSAWIGGFICRSISVFNTDHVGLYVGQYFLVIVAPVMYAASEYFILGRLLAYLPYYTPLHPGRVLSTFLFLSGAVEGLTAAGASLFANEPTPDQRVTALSLIKAALILQGVVELCFMSLVVQLEHRARKGRLFNKNVRIMCYVIYVTSTMILVRCIFRAIEGFTQSDCPRDNPSCTVIDRHEWFLWVFEVANMTLFSAVLLIFPPGRYLPSRANVYLDPIDGKTERIGPGFSEASQRGFVASVVDPFDVWGLITGKASTRLIKFWEQDNPPVAAQSNGLIMEKNSDQSPGDAPKPCEMCIS